MKKLIFAFLLLSILLLNVSACGKEPFRIEDREWRMRTVMHTEGESVTVPAVGEVDAAYPDAKIIDLTLTAKNGTLTVTDATNSKTYTGTYKRIDIDLESDNYEVTIDGETGYATVSVTNYHDGSEEATLLIRCGDDSVYFYAESGDRSAEN